LPESSILDAIRHFVRIRVGRNPQFSANVPGSFTHTPVQLAACALMLELAHADDVFSVEEKEHIEGAIRKHFGLTQEEGAELLRLAEAERTESLDHFQFTRRVAAEYDLRQKMVLAEIMWGVILADGRLSDHEAHLLRKMASLMQLEPAYLAQARRAAAGES
jgi:uncharacterized tellurite resistance protein B-like protein